MASLGFRSQSQRRFLQAWRPDVAQAWDAGRTLGGHRFTPRPPGSLPIHSGTRRQPRKRRKGRI
jgi:hypothetical protein